MSETGHGVKTFSQNNPFNVFNSFNYDQLFVKTKVKGLNGN